MRLGLDLALFCGVYAASNALFDSTFYAVLAAIILTCAADVFAWSDKKR
ncbi:MAG: hypothetical protein AAFW81_06785 [Pseudomonadota bacterium]